MAKLSLTKVQEEIGESGFSYVSGDYQNLDSVLIVKCENNHEFPTTLKKIRTKKVICEMCEGYRKAEEKEIQMTSVPKKQGTRVLGLDNATNTTGYAIFENGQLLTYGIKKTSKNDPIRKAAELKQWLVGMLKLWEIDYLALENVQYQGNPQTLIVLAKLLGILENAAFEITNLEPIVVYSSTWKSHCQIKGKTRAAQKEDAQNFVKRKFNIVATQDACDAICLTIYAVDQIKLNQMITF